VDFTWASGTTDATCVPCGHTGDAERVFEWESRLGTPLSGTRCGVCSSITIHGGAMEFPSQDESIDGYVQSEAGIDSMLANLYRVDAPAGARLLEVGANFGFVVRYARDVLGWHALGVEPSYAARRGARELGVEILEQYVTAETTLDGRFDVILASEVIEHVPDPGEFVRALRAHVAPGGIVVMTTPAQDAVARETPEAARQAVTPGGHQFLFSMEAIEQLMRREGFGSVAVDREGMSLIVCAAVEPARDLRTESTGPGPYEVADFFGALESDPGSPPLLAAAMAVRKLRSLVNLGEDAAEAEGVAFARVREQYALDLSEPRALAERLPERESVPLLLAPAAYAAGMRRVVHRHDWAQAASYFALAEAAVAEKRRRAHIFDSDSRIIEAQSRAHRVLATLHTDPARAIEEWQALLAAGRLEDPARWAIRLLVEAAALDRSDVFDEYLDQVAEAVAQLGTDGGTDHSMAVIDAATLLGRAASDRRDPQCASQWYSAAEQVLEARRTVLDDGWCAMVEATLRQLRARLETMPPAPNPSAVPRPAWMLGSGLTEWQV